MTEVAETVSLIRGKSELPDCRCRHWLRQCHQYPADCEALKNVVPLAIQLEDQDFPKRCGHLRDKSVIPVREMTGKLKAVGCPTIRRHPDHCPDRCGGIRRTGSLLGTLGTLPGNGNRYPVCRSFDFFDQMRLVNEQFGSKTLLMANMVEGGKTLCFRHPNSRKSVIPLLSFPED